MSFYEWSETMSVGVELLDSDHKALIQLINRLHKALEDDADPSQLKDVFAKLALYVERHFEREEQVMKACGYPETSQHQEEHRRFAENMRYQRDRYFGAGERGVGEDLLVSLKDWLNHHILIQDMAYKPYVEENDLANQAARNFGPGLSERQR
jgi:hemerythrin-like metal-binding protein